MASRSEEKATAAIERIQKAVGTDLSIHYLPLDLADLHSVQACAETFLRQEGKLHGLINNAGIMMVPHGHTKEGFEVQFGTNYVGHYYLTKLLMGALEKASQEDGQSRVVNVSSMAALSAYWGVQLGEDGNAGSTSMSRYAQSKLAMVAWTKYLARKYADKNIIFTAVHPGVIMTDLYVPFSTSGFFGDISTKLMRMLMPSITVDQGAMTTLYAAVSPKVTDKENGTFFGPGPGVMIGASKAGDTKLQEEMIEWTEKKLAEKGFA